LQRWLEKHGDQVEALQLHECCDSAMLTALPCPQLHDFLLRSGRYGVSFDSRVWSDIAAATKLTSVSLDGVQTASLQADVVSALTALPDLEQLTWSNVKCGPQPRSLSDSQLLQELTKLIALTLVYVDGAAALEHLGLLTRLQDLSLSVTDDWAAAGCPGLQELKALTRLDLDDVSDYGSDSIPPSVSQLTALQQLAVPRATPTSVNKLSALTGLTRLHVLHLVGLSPGPPPLQLPGLQYLEVFTGGGTMPSSFLANCTQLRVLVLWDTNLSGTGSLLASSMLQRLELSHCRASAADGVTDPVSWQQIFPGPGRLPHLTSLKMTYLDPALQHADTECVVACCSSLQALHLGTLQDSVASALTCLSGLTSLALGSASDQQCSSLAQLAGLRELRVRDASKVSAGGLRQLAALEQLTSLGLQRVGNSSEVLREHMSDRLPGPPLYECVIIIKVCLWVGGGGGCCRTSIGTQITAIVSYRAPEKYNCTSTTQACIVTEHEHHQ